MPVSELNILMRAKSDIVNLDSVQEFTVLFSLFTWKYAKQILKPAYNMIKLALVSEMSFSMPVYYAETYLLTPASGCSMCSR
jgi:hypothetical protein